MVLIYIPLKIKKISKKAETISETQQNRVSQDNALIFVDHQSKHGRPHLGQFIFKEYFLQLPKNRLTIVYLIITVKYYNNVEELSFSLN